MVMAKHTQVEGEDDGYVDLDSQHEGKHPHTYKQVKELSFTVYIMALDR